VRLIQERSRAGVIHPTNPIDLGDIFDFTVYPEIMAALCRDPEVDGVLLHYGPLAEFEVPAAREMARQFLKLARDAGKPLAITVLCSLEEEDFFRDSLGVPVFHFPEEAVKALALRRDLQARGAPTPLEVATPLPGEGQIFLLLAPQTSGDFLPLPQALALVEALGIAVAPWQTATGPQEAVEASWGLGFPVALKLVAPSLIHKTEAGGVLLNLKDEAAVASGVARLAEIARNTLPLGEAWQVLVMSQVEDGLEVLLGAREDQDFGAIVAFGAGGIATEILEDVALLVAPVNEAQAGELMAETRMGRILAGIRGQPASDLAALSQALAALSRLMEKFPRIKEVDLNPVRVFPGKPGLRVLDARIRLG
jgi:acyl-CoA synthetase (NDP forming)